MLFLPCTASEITTTTTTTPAAATTTTTTPTPTPTPTLTPPAAALLLLPLLLVLVLLGCCFVCTPWPANKDCGPVVVVTGGVSTTKGKNKKKYTSSGTGCQIRLQASQNKTNPCMLHGAPVFVSTTNNNNNNIPVPFFAPLWMDIATPLNLGTMT